MKKILTLIILAIIIFTPFQKVWLNELVNAEILTHAGGPILTYSSFTQETFSIYQLITYKGRYEPVEKP